MSKTNFKNLYNPAGFAQQGLLVFELLQDFLQNAQSEGSKTINYRSPEEELDYWKNWPNKHKDAAENQKIQALISSLFGHTNHIHNPKYSISGPEPIFLDFVAIKMISEVPGIRLNTSRAPKTGLQNRQCASNSSV